MYIRIRLYAVSPRPEKSKTNRKISTLKRRDLHMYITGAIPAIATTQTYCVSVAEQSYRIPDTQTVANQELEQYLEKQVQAIAPEPAKAQITISQRKARSHDKNRLKWIDAKRLALTASGCIDTPEVRKWLKFLNVRNLRLSMTSAWVAVRHDLATKIKLARAKETNTTPSNVVSLSHYKQGARSAKDCARIWEAIQEYRELERQNSINIIVTAMRDAIASANWEFMRQALVSREKHKADAWALLTATEKQQLEALVPVEIRLLKAAMKRGAIASFREDDEGAMFWIWQDINAEPKLMSGTTVRNFYGIP